MIEPHISSFPNEGFNPSIRTVTKIEITNNENNFSVYKETFLFVIDEISINYTYSKSYYDDITQNISFTDIYYWNTELKHFIKNNIGSSSVLDSVVNF